MKRKELVFGRDHRHRRVRRDLLEIDPAVVGLVVGPCRAREASSAASSMKALYHGSIQRMATTGSAVTRKRDDEPDESPSRPAAAASSSSSHLSADALVIVTSAAGTFWWPERVVVATLAILSMTSMPAVTLPNTA